MKNAQPIETYFNFLNAYNYYLPNRLIAQYPIAPRGETRLLILPRQGGKLKHTRVSYLLHCLKPGDLLVFNNTKVIKARLWAHKFSGGRVELLLLDPIHPIQYEQGGQVHKALLRSSRPVIEGQDLILEGNPPLNVHVLQRNLYEEGEYYLIWIPGNVLELTYKRGEVPLPPYIKRPWGPTLEDSKRYQTIYASREGAIAAPTAGLHFSAELLLALKQRGIEMAQLTLHVGYGTFAEPSVKNFLKGSLHSEWVEILEETSQAVARAKKRGARIVAVGTTSLRALEWRSRLNGIIKPRTGWCDLFITPGFNFQVVNSLFTNFHLPRTTLLMLISALVGREQILAAYAEAIQKNYYFYSFGDAMLIL